MEQVQGVATPPVSIQGPIESVCACCGELLTVAVLWHAEDEYALDMCPHCLARAIERATGYRLLHMLKQWDAMRSLGLAHKPKKRKPYGENASS